MLNEAVLTEMYPQLFSQMYQWLISAGGIPEVHAKDLVQETFRKLFHRRHTIADDLCPTALLWTILRNLRIDYFRRHRRLIPLEVLETEGILPTTAEPHRHNDLDCDYIRTRIQTATKHLPEDMRTTYRLFFEEECSIKEIAKRMKCSENLVKVRIYRTRTRLQPQLKDLR